MATSEDRCDHRYSHPEHGICGRYLLALGVFDLWEFLFNATFILLPVLGAMLFLDFGLLRYTSEIAKTASGRQTTYSSRKSLLQTSAAAAGSYADIAGQVVTAAQGQQAGDPGFREVLEEYFFW